MRILLAIICCVLLSLKATSQEAIFKEKGFARIVTLASTKAYEYDLTSLCDVFSVQKLSDGKCLGFVFFGEQYDRELYFIAFSQPKYAVTTIILMDVAVDFSTGKGGNDAVIYLTATDQILKKIARGKKENNVWTWAIDTTSQPLDFSKSVDYWISQIYNLESLAHIR